MARTTADGRSEELPHAPSATDRPDFRVDPLTLETNSLLIGTVKAATESAEPLLSRFNLTPSRVAVIALLHRTPEHKLTVGEIAVGLHVTSTNVSRRIDGLVREGWVERAGNPGDGRSVYITLTDSGAARADEILPIVYQRLGVLWSVLDDREKATLAELLSRLRARAVSMLRVPGPVE